MIYMLKVIMLVAGATFGLAGLFIAGVYVWTEAKKYAHALLAMQRIALPVTREPVAISRIHSKSRLRLPIKGGLPMLIDVKYDAYQRTFKLIDEESRTLLEGDALYDLGIPLMFEESGVDEDISPIAIQPRMRRTNMSAPEWLERLVG